MQTAKAIETLRLACVVFLALIVCSVPAFSQVQTASETHSAVSEPLAANTNSDLARQNFERVSATAPEIETVLQKDPGLMVELKRWIAEDATDHGQLVSDSDLTDRAIYQRLQDDIRFRSAATLLLERYGYLQPRLNPDSIQGQEQQLVIQQRAQMIAEYQQRPLTEGRQNASFSPQGKQICHVGQNRNGLQGCGVQQGGTSREQNQEIEAPVVPETVPNLSTPALSPHNAPLLEQAQQGLPDNELAMDGSSENLDGINLLSGSGQAGSGPMTSPSQLQSLFSQASLNGNSWNGAMQPNMTSSGLLPLETQSAAIDGIADGFLSEPGDIRGGTERESSSNETMHGAAASPDLSRLLIRQPVPYVDVPSLYDMYLQAQPQPPTPERFGIQVFEDGARDSQTIPFDLPVGPGYVVGPGDSLSLDLWGGVSRRLFRTVDPEGRVALPEVGPVLVAGKSLAQVQESVQRMLRSQFRDVSADVSLARLRTIRVYVVGDVKHPGAYDVSSLSTPLNALFAAGGPTDDGSLRILEHKRAGDLVQDVDVYDLLLRGVSGSIDRLENGDTVMVPPIGPQVTVEGMVRRPAIYELRTEKSLGDVLALAGGLLPTATLRHIEVQRVIEHQAHTMVSFNVAPNGDAVAIKKQLESFPIQDGDKIRVFPIAPYNDDIVYLEGHVIRPGKYSYRPGMRLTDLISSYKDLLPEPANQYAEIIRLNPPDFRPTVESFNLADALKHPGSAPLLQPLDTVQIFGRYDFENRPTVSVGGDVRTPGTYLTSGQLHLTDAIHMAGGLGADAEKNDAQVFRYESDGQLKIFSVNLAEALAGNPDDNIVLNSRDRILVHRNPADVDPASVSIRGEVGRPGRYPLTTNMTVADLIRAAGGAKESADMKDADLTRYDWNSRSVITGQHKEVELADALAGAGDANIRLRNGDVLTIRKRAGWDDLGASIMVDGEVVHPGSYGIRPGERLSSILSRAGGFMPDAYPYGAVLIRPDVQQLEDKSQTELVARVREQQTGLALATKEATDPDTKLSDQAAYQQWQNTLDELLNNPPLGRVTIQISEDIKNWQDSPRDIAVRAGDRLVIPKRPSYVMVQGQVFNPTAVAFHPGRSAKWYLSQAGGPTNLANKHAIFVIRADGSVIGAHGASFFFESALGQSLQPGDVVVVPEKALGGPPQWKALFQAIQVGSSVATAAVFAAKY